MKKAIKTHHAVHRSNWQEPLNCSLNQQEALRHL